jgi:hypothetical protein
MQPLDYLKLVKESALSSMLFKKNVKVPDEQFNTKKEAEKFFSEVKLLCPTVLLIEPIDKVSKAFNGFELGKISIVILQENDRWIIRHFNDNKY